MPQQTKPNGKEIKALRDDILKSIDARLWSIHQAVDNVARRQDSEAERMDSLSSSYVLLEKDLTNHLHHMGWGQIGQVAVELIGFLAVIAKLTGWF